MCDVTIRRRALTAAAIAPVLFALGACSRSVSVDSGATTPPAISEQVQAAQGEGDPDLEVADAEAPGRLRPGGGRRDRCTVSIEGVEAPYTVTFTR